MVWGSVTDTAKEPSKVTFMHLIKAAKDTKILFRRKQHELLWRPSWEYEMVRTYDNVNYFPIRFPIWLRRNEPSNIIILKSVNYGIHWTTPPRWWVPSELWHTLNYSTGIKAKVGTFQLRRIPNRSLRFPWTVRKL